MTPRFVETQRVFSWAIVLSLVWSASSAAQGQKDQMTIIEDVTLIDAKSNKAQPHMTVVLSGNPMERMAEESVGQQ